MSKSLTDRARVFPALVVAVVIAVGSTLVILLSGGSSGASYSAAAATAVGGGKGKPLTVDISMFAFRPSTVTIALGTKVAFTNRDTTEHTATSDNATAFDTGAIQDQQTKIVSFTKAGTYAYHCAFHPFMTGTVIVK